MPLPLLAVAVPVLHSSGAWIASSAAAGYISGTLSSTWIGAFVLGNSGLLSSLGLVSAAGIFGASGGITAMASGTALSVGSALTAVGLGGVATSLGIAPVATFLGLTPVGWAIVGGTVTAASTLGYLFMRKVMSRINEERLKGGLDAITLKGLVSEIRNLESESLTAILARLDAESAGVSLANDRKHVTVHGELYPVSRLRYFVDKDGSEEIIRMSRAGLRTRVLLVKAPPVVVA